MESPLPVPRRRVSFVTQILIALACGAMLGQLRLYTKDQDPVVIAEAVEVDPSVEPTIDEPVPVLVWLGRQAEPLGMLGSLIVNLIKGLAGPLLFFAVVDAFLRTRVRGRDASMMVGISLTNATIAVVIGLTLSNVLRPGDYLEQPLGGGTEAAEAFEAGAREIDFLGDLLGFIPSSIVEPFLENSILSIVILAVLGGAALRRVKDEQIAVGQDDYRIVERFVATVYRGIEIALAWIIALVPLAVFGVVAKTVAQDGFRPFLGLFAYVGVAILGLAIQVFLVYQSWILFVSRRSLREFWRGARDAIAYALGASSSLATLPVTLKCLERMKVSVQASRLAACVGTNLNNDGILLYEAMAVLFVAQVYGIELSLSQQFLAALCCVIAGIGIAGIPEAGLISLALVLTTVGLPIEILPLLLTVDWALSRCRAMTNVVSDILVAVLLDRFGVGHSDQDGEAPTFDTFETEPDTETGVAAPTRGGNAGLK